MANIWEACTFYRINEKINEILKLVLAIFYEILIFSLNDSHSKTVKNIFYSIEKALFVLEIFKFM